MARAVLVVLVTVLTTAGCTSPAADDPCSEPAIAGDGSVVHPEQPYWTLSTDQVPIRDGQDRVDEIPAIIVAVDGVEVPTVTRAATVDGEDWTERWWGCRLAKLDHVPTDQGSHFTVQAQSDEADSITMTFLFRDCNGTLIGYAPDPEWSVEGPVLSETLGQIRAGTHDVLATVAYGGSSRTHHFQVDHDGGCP